MTSQTARRKAHLTVEKRLEQMKDDLRKLVTVMNQDNSFEPARNAQAALEMVDTLIDNLPVEQALWPPRIDQDGAFVCVPWEER